MRHVRNEKRVSEKIELPNQEKIRTLGEKQTYKYLGILEADTIKQVETKEKNLKEYLRRKLLEKKLYSRKFIKEINTWAVPPVRYLGPFLKWTREDLKQMYLSKRKLLTVCKTLHPTDDVHRLYVSRKKEEGDSSALKTALRHRYNDYTEKRRRRLITATRNNTDDTRIS